MNHHHFKFRLFILVVDVEVLIVVDVKVVVVIDVVVVSVVVVLVPKLKQQESFFKFLCL